jgi:hypothetical protein
MEMEQLRVSVPFTQPTNARVESSNRLLERGESKTMFLEFILEPCAMSPFPRGYACHSQFPTGGVFPGLKLAEN